MSPSKSNTIVFPSGLRSKFIHVPSATVNETSLNVPIGLFTSHFLSLSGVAAINSTAEVIKNNLFNFIKNSLQRK